VKQFCEEAIRILAATSGRAWAEEFVRLRMEFHRLHARGLIVSTWHGTDFFENVLKGLAGIDIGEPKGDYRNNFIKLIAIGL